MNNVHEAFRDLQNTLIYLRRSNIDCEPHYHFLIELLIIAKGTYEVNNNGENVTIEGPAAILFDSFTTHGYKQASENADGMFLIIPSTFFNDYRTFMEGYQLKNNIIQNKKIVEQILFLYEAITNTQDDYLTNCFVNAILRLFILEGDTIEREKYSQLNILNDVLLYINKNFQQDISLASISTQFNYSESHLSRIFHSVFPYSINTYINKLRIHYVKLRKNKNNQNMLALIYEAGFKSPQTYYRNVKKLGET